MAYNLGELLFEVAKELGLVQLMSEATGGTTTTVVDTSLDADSNEFDDSSIIIFETTDNADPEFEFKKISSYDSASNTFTVPTLSAAVGSGDKYCVLSAQFTLLQLIEFINTGLRALGDIEYVDTTTLDSIEDITEYVSQIGWNKNRPTKIFIQTLAEASNNLWKEISPDSWTHMLPSLPGETGLIIFDTPLPAGYDLKIIYRNRHTKVKDFDDNISETIPMNLAIASIKKVIRNYFAQLTQFSDESAKALYDDANNNYKEAKNTDKVNTTTSKGKGFNY